jgi:hypothetical protein
MLITLISTVNSCRTVLMAFPLLNTKITLIRHNHCRSHVTPVDLSANTLITLISTVNSCRTVLMDFPSLEYETNTNTSQSLLKLCHTSRLVRQYVNNSYLYSKFLQNGTNGIPSLEYENNINTSQSLSKLRHTSRLVRQYVNNSYLYSKFLQNSTNGIPSLEYETNTNTSQSLSKLHHTSRLVRQDANNSYLYSKLYCIVVHKSFNKYRRNGKDYELKLPGRAMQCGKREKKANSVLINGMIYYSALIFHIYVYEYNCYSPH